MDEAPALDAAETWLNGGPVRLEGRDGPTLIHLWRYACDACVDDIPQLRRLHEAYSGAGLSVVGVHTPRFPFEADADNVAAALDRYDVTYPVACDPDNTLWKRYGKGHRPRTVLVADATVEDEALGTGGPARLEERLRRLLRRRGNDIGEPVLDWEPVDRHAPVSPVVYAGIGHGAPLGNDHAAAPHTMTAYAENGERVMNRLYLQGRWRREDEYLAAAGDGYAAVRFAGTAAGAVVGEAGRWEVLLDGDAVPDGSRGEDITVRDGRTYVDADMPRLYRVVSFDAPRVAEFELVPPSDGGRLYACTFR